MVLLALRNLDHSSRLYATKFWVANMQDSFAVQKSWWLVWPCLWKVQMKLIIRLTKAADLEQSSLSLFCLLSVCVCSIISLQLEELGRPSFPYQMTELQVNASHAAQSIAPLLVYLGTVLPCLEGRGMEMRLGNATRLRKETFGLDESSSLKDTLLTWVSLPLRRWEKQLHGGKKY